MDRAGRLQRQGFVEIPEQLVERPHDREHLVHLLRIFRGLLPVLPTEGHLRDPLSRAETVV